MREPSDDGAYEPEVVVVPIDGALDLHTFRPREVAEVVEAYLEACREVGITEVRIIHGKGTGALRRSVQAVLARLPGIARVRPGGPAEGGWGATIAVLDPAPGGQEPAS